MNQMVNTETKIWNRTFISVFLTNALMYMAQQMVQPLITSYVKSIGATAAIIGIIASAYTWTAILMKVISAPAIDTYNKKYLLCGGMAVMGIAFTGFALFGSIPSVMAFRLIQGCGQAFTTSCQGTNWDRESVSLLLLNPSAKPLGLPWENIFRAWLALKSPLPQQPVSCSPVRSSRC